MRSRGVHRFARSHSARHAAAFAWPRARLPSGARRPPGDSRSHGVGRRQLARRDQRPGRAGVTTFFVLSGYLITSLLIRDGGPIRLREFYRRRFVRRPRIARPARLRRRGGPGRRMAPTVASGHRLVTRLFGELGGPVLLRPWADAARVDTFHRGAVLPSLAAHPGPDAAACAARGTRRRRRRRCTPDPWISPGRSPTSRPRRTPRRSPRACARLRPVALPRWAAIPGLLGSRSPSSSTRPFRPPLEPADPVLRFGPVVPAAPSAASLLPVPVELAALLCCPSCWSSRRPLAPPLAS